MKILLIEDEKALSMALCELLKDEGFLVDTAYNGADGLDSALTGIYDIIVLDIMLPKLNGMELLKQIRQHNIPSSILMLTAKSSKEDIIIGLKSGADDYVTKPFDTNELLARIWALSRRNANAYHSDSLSFADISLSRTTHQLMKGDKKIVLSAKEYQLLEILLLNQNAIVSRETCIVKIWGYDTDMEYNGPDVYISFLRKKLRALQSIVNIKSVRGIGYSLEKNHESTHSKTEE